MNTNKLTMKTPQDGALPTPEVPAAVGSISRHSANDNARSLVGNGAYSKCKTFPSVQDNGCSMPARKAGY